MRQFLFSIMTALLCCGASFASTLDGRVTDQDGKPLAGIQVSDGESITLTDAQGYYTICSSKKFGYVFIEIPRGYEAVLEGVFPKFWAGLNENEVDEVHDFVLRKVDNDEYTLLALGDFHLCNRKSLKDIPQFKVCAADICETVRNEQKAGRKVYVLTLGDMTWDLYWDDNQKLADCNFDLNAYRKFINETITEEVAFFHTMGNHDNDYREKGDWNAAGAYRKIMGPTFYSFNLGEFHYIVLDNVICKNDGTVKGRKNDMGITVEQISWVRADMQNVAPGTPVIVSMHEQVYRLDSADKGHIANASVAALNAAIGKNHRIHYITADTHIINNYGKPSDRISEHNAGAICGDWWWTGRHSYDGHLDCWKQYKGKSYFLQARDGAPCGYTIYSMKGHKWESQWKSIGLDRAKQFKTYDRNSIVINSQKYPLPEKFAKNFDSDASDYASESSENLVYINVWNYDPSWEIKVQEVESGKKLKVRECPGIVDPMMLINYNLGRYFDGAKPSKVFMANKSMHHIFMVKATSATSTLKIDVTDGFGRKYTQTMTRPKNFAIDWE